MKKIVVVITMIVFTMTAIPPAFAGRYHRYYHAGHYPRYYGAGHFHGYCHYRHHDEWIAFGIGALTGTLIGAFFRPPERVYAVSPGVVVSPGQTVVVHPPPVVFHDSYAVVQPPEAVSGKVSVIVHTLNVRSGPSFDHPVITQTYRGEILTIYGQSPHSPRWYYVQLPSGKFGWVVAQFTSPLSSPGSG